MNLCRYLSHLCLAATIILWWHASVDMMVAQNLPGVLTNLSISLFPAGFGAFFADLSERASR